MHINYFALTPHVDTLFHFLEANPVEFHIEGEELNMSEIKSLHLTPVCKFQKPQLCSFVYTILMSYINK